jgi:hypothetical protein
LAAVPVVNILAKVIFCEAVALLNLAFELVSTAIYDLYVKVVVVEFSPLLLDPRFNLLPISLHSIPVHVNLRRPAHDMIGSEHTCPGVVPFPAPRNTRL